MKLLANCLKNYNLDSLRLGDFARAKKNYELIGLILKIQNPSHFFSNARVVHQVKNTSKNHKLFPNTFRVKYYT